MPIRLELRGEISRAMIYWSPIFAVVLTFIAGIIMFAILGVDPIAAIFTFFIEPLNSIDGIVIEIIHLHSLRFCPTILNVFTESVPQVGIYDI